MALSVLWGVTGHREVFSQSARSVAGARGSLCAETWALPGEAMRRSPSPLLLAHFPPVLFEAFEQCRPVELLVMQDMFCLTLSNTVATSHMWLFKFK